MFVLGLTAASSVLLFETKFWVTFREARSEHDEVLSLSQASFLRSVVLLRFCKIVFMLIWTLWDNFTWPVESLIEGKEKRHHAWRTPVNRWSPSRIPLSTTVGLDTVANHSPGPVASASKVHLSLLLLLPSATWIPRERGVMRS